MATSALPLRSRGEERSDEEILAEIRGGDLSGLELLYERHRGAALRFVRRYCRGNADAEDLVAEGFTTVLEALSRGRGPVDGFRVYLLVAVRNHAARRYSEREYLTGEDEYAAALDERDARAGGSGDNWRIVDERGLLARAFAELPERWRAVLWHTEVEGESPRVLAAQFGLKPNGVSALAYRARHALRRAYLKAHINERAQESCRPFAERIVDGAIGGTRVASNSALRAHLRSCLPCRGLRRELDELSSRMRVQVSAAVLGPVAAAAYLGHSGGVTMNNIILWIAQHVNPPAWFGSVSEQVVSSSQRAGGTVAAGTVAVTIGLVGVGQTVPMEEVIGALPASPKMSGTVRPGAEAAHRDVTTFLARDGSSVAGTAVEMWPMPDGTISHTLRPPLSGFPDASGPVGVPAPSGSVISVLPVPPGGVRPSPDKGRCDDPYTTPDLPSLARALPTSGQSSAPPSTPTTTVTTTPTPTVTSPPLSGSPGGVTPDPTSGTTTSPVQC